MTPAERLKAAIEKLETLRAATDPVRPDSHWVVDYQVGETMRFITVLDSHNGGYDGSIVAHDVTSEACAQLIVTLHRTIDAQLTILRHELARAETKIANGAVEHHVWSHTADALALADAILGETP